MCRAHGERTEDSTIHSEEGSLEGRVTLGIRNLRIIMKIIIFVGRFGQKGRMRMRLRKSGIKEIMLLYETDALPTALRGLVMLIY